MAEKYDFRVPRVFLADDLAPGRMLACTREQANYLRNVLRLGEGAEVLVFNGRDGEWLARVVPQGRRDAALAPLRRTRAQQAGPDLHYVFAPLKHARLDYMVQKATELGAGVLRPVLTRRTVASRVNLERMRANVIEAAEQCGILHVPRVTEPRTLDEVLAGWDAGRPLVFCDEGNDARGPMDALSRVPPGPMAVLIGPEGGFDPAERQALRAKPYVHAVSLGPRVMRADTAAVAALALVNAVLGDWR